MVHLFGVVSGMGRRFEVGGSAEGRIRNWRDVIYACLPSHIILIALIDYIHTHIDLQSHSLYVSLLA